MNKNHYNDVYMPSIIKWGRTTQLLGLIFMFSKLLRKIAMTCKAAQICDFNNLHVCVRKQGSGREDSFSANIFHWSATQIFLE